MDTDFMTTKEKDYVSHVLTKNYRQYKTDVDFKKLFQGIKQEYIPIKTEVKTSFVFGKDNCRDNKKNRYFTCMKNIPESLEIDCEINNLITKTVFKRHFTTDISLNFNIERFLKNRLLWKLLNLTFEDSKSKKEWIITLMNNFDVIDQVKEFKEFINTWYDKIPEFNINDTKDHFLCNFMTKNTGLILATCFLLNNNQLFGIFYDKFNEKSNLALELDDVWNFLVVMMKFCDKDQKFKIVQMTKKRLFEIRNEIDKIRSARSFLKCLGLNVEDLLD